MDVVDDLSNQEKADLEFDKWMDAGATDEIKAAVEHFGGPQHQLLINMAGGAHVTQEGLVT
jgi:hypothetical protein